MSVSGSNGADLSTRGFFRYNLATTKRSTSNEQNKQLITQLKEKGFIQLSETNTDGKQKTHVEFDMDAINTYLNKLLQELRSITTENSQNETGVKPPEATEKNPDQAVQEMISTLEEIGRHLQNNGSALANKQGKTSWAGLT